MGDEHCGTEHLLFGIIATGRGEIAEMSELFALNTLRAERALKLLRGHHCAEDGRSASDPPLSTRVEVVLHSKPMDGSERLSCFDLLVAMIRDSRSGASTMLRNLGIRLGEIRCLAELGAARLDRSEIEGLIAALDRRSTGHEPWWGPAQSAPVARVSLPDSRPQLLGRSETAVATLDGVVAGPEGFGLTITIVSCDDWMLPPRWEPEEMLLPGLGAVHRSAPDVVTIDLRYGDGQIISNRDPRPRYRSGPPPPGILVRLGTRSIIDDRNDRRSPARRSETSEWWAWPLPAAGPVSVAFEWPAEALGGVIELDVDRITTQAEALRSRG